MRKSARSLQYWLDLGYSREDAEHMRRTKMPGTFEYFSVFKNMSDEDARLAVISWKDSHKVTKENMIRRYGEDEGIIRWDKYRNKQAHSNSFEYKRDRRGWTKDQFDDFNAGRSVTRKNLVSKYGAVKGEEKYQAYVERQRHTTSLEYFISIYGEVDGQLKYDRFSRLRRHTYESYLEKYDGDEVLATAALEKFWKARNSKTYNTSKIADDFCQSLYTSMRLRGEFSVFHQSLNQEYYFGLKGFGVAFVDFYCKDTNKAVEFYGDYWHANPAIYGPTDVMKYPNKVRQLAEDVWADDHTRINALLSKVTDVKIVWERDYNTNPIQVISTLTDWITHEN